jgi:pSer/pThr/pTyr-binding forkhead associated (FHA) protein
MWALRVLTGPLTGKIISFKTGRNLLGRSSACDIQLPLKQISKEHCEFEYSEDRLSIKDLNSRNGIYINGAKIAHSALFPGDKISVNDLLFDIVILRGSNETAKKGATSNGLSEINENFQNLNIYLEKNLMPAIFKLTEVLDLKTVLGLILVGYIFLVTALSMIPMVQLTSASIEAESKRRALSIARRLQSENQTALRTGVDSQLSLESADAEEGVKYALIVSQANGTILAPAAKAGDTPDLPFVSAARKETRETVLAIDSSTIAASVPMTVYSPEIGTFAVKAHAIVVYDMGSLAFDDGRALSLFIQTFTLALLIGLIIYYFMYKLIEHPVNLLNQNLQSALIERHESVVLNLKYPGMQKLIDTINGLLNRYLHGLAEAQDGGSTINRDFESENLLQIIGHAGLSIHKEGYIISANASFESDIGFSLASIKGQKISSFPDAALQQNLEDLIFRAQENPNIISINDLDFGGNRFSLCCQAILTSSGECEYFIISFIRQDGGTI